MDAQVIDMGSKQSIIWHSRASQMPSGPIYQTQIHEQPISGHQTKHNTVSNQYFANLINYSANL